MRVGGTVQNTLKGGGTEKRRGETKIIKSGKLSQRVGALKRGGGGVLKRGGGGGWNPLLNDAE